MEYHAESLGHLERQLGARQVLSGPHVLVDFGCDFERSAAAAFFVEQALHAFLFEGLGDQVEGSSRVAVLAGGADHR